MKRIVFLFGLLILTSCTYNEITPVCEPDEQMFSDLVQPIIESNCIVCHAESNSRPAVLETYDGVIDALNNRPTDSQHQKAFEVDVMQLDLCLTYHLPF